MIRTIDAVCDAGLARNALGFVVCEFCGASMDAWVPIEGGVWYECDECGAVIAAVKGGGVMLDLEAIKKRYEAATEGPWEPTPDSRPDVWAYVWAKSPGVGYAGEGQIVRRLHAAADHIRVHIAELAKYENANYDADFIAHAREDVPALVAEVERLRVALDVFSKWDDAAETIRADLISERNAALVENEALRRETPYLVFEEPFDKLAVALDPNGEEWSVPGPTGEEFAPCLLELIEQAATTIGRLREENDALRAEKAASVGEYHWMFPCSKCGRSEYTSHAFTLADGSLGCAWCAVREAREGVC